MIAGTAYKSLEGRRALSRQALQQCVCSTKPVPLATPQVAGHGRFFCQNTLRPFTSLGLTALRGQEACVVVVVLGQRRSFGDLLKEGLGLGRLSRACVGMREQSGGAARIVLGITRHHVFYVGNRSGKIAQLNLRNATAIECIGHVSA